MEFDDNIDDIAMSGTDWYYYISTDWEYISRVYTVYGAENQVVVAILGEYDDVENAREKWSRGRSRLFIVTTAR